MMQDNLALEILRYISTIVTVGFFIGMSMLYFVSIYRKKYMLKVELLKWKHNKYSSEISCDIGITNISKPTFLINGVYIKPAYSSSAFSKKRYMGTIEKGNFPISFSTLQRKKFSISFPIDLSSYYDIDENNSKTNKQWLLILKTNRLEREFRIDAPFSVELLENT